MTGCANLSAPNLAHGRTPTPENAGLPPHYSARLGPEWGRVWYGNCSNLQYLPGAGYRTYQERMVPDVITSQFSIRDIKNLLRRRRNLVRLSFSLIFIISTIGAFILPRRYESSITILVQRDETLNPLISYEMAVAMTSEDRLRTFNEIIYSRPSMESLIDTIGLRAQIRSTAQEEDLIRDLRKNVKTERKGDSFSLNYTDVFPVRAQLAVSALSSYFITTRLQVERQRDEQTVEFFENKLEELRLKYEVNQKQMVSLLRERIQELPKENHTLYTQMEDIDKHIGEIDARVQAYQRDLALLRSFPGAFQTELGKQALDELQRADIPFSGELRTLYFKYDELSRKYTSKYTEVAKLQAQLLDLLDRMRKGVETEIAKGQNDRWDLAKRRGESISDLKQASVAQRVDGDQESSFGIYQKLYDEMKVKLEQARTARDLGKRAADQFIIIDPPQVPAEPSKPNRPMIVGAGLGVGLLMGLLSAGAAQLPGKRVKGAEEGQG